MKPLSEKFSRGGRWGLLKTDLTAFKRWKQSKRLLDCFYPLKAVRLDCCQSLINESEKHIFQRLGESEQNWRQKVNIFLGEG